MLKFHQVMDKLNASKCLHIYSDIFIFNPFREIIFKYVRIFTYSVVRFPISI